MTKNKFIATLMAYDNSVDAFNPELWANESLMILEGNLLFANRVHRDFEPVIANYGDTVNTRQPATFKAKRKGVNAEVTIQNAEATNVPVKLNQLLHVSFMIKDAQRAWSFKDLVAEYLSPALLAEAEGVDLALLGRIGGFLANNAGMLHSMSTSTAKSDCLAARKVLNDNKVPFGARDCLLTSNSETTILGVSDFLDAAYIGDDGSALREASIGRKLGFNFYMQQSAPSTQLALTDVVTGAVNNAGGHAIGATSITVDGLSAAISNGTWFTVAGDMIPHQVTGTTGGATPTAIAFTPALKRAVADNAVVTLFDPGAVNLAAGYAAGWDQAITVDAFTLAPQVGQFVTFGTATDVYMIIEASTTSIMLDRPLDAAIVDNATVNLLPTGDYNFAYHRNAVALVTRPLPLPQAGMGAKAAVVNYNGLSIRVVMTYQGKEQGTLVTVDMLLGTALLNAKLGAVLFG